MPVDKDFEKLIETARLAQASIGQATADGGQRRWFDLKELTVVGQFDLAALGELFSRQSVNDIYGSKLTEDGAQTKEFQTAKLTNDYLAGLERDQAARMRSRVATIMHGASRARANGATAGPLRRNTIDFLTRIQNEDDATAASEEEG